MKPIEAWASIVENPEVRKSYTAARGLGGLVRTTWDEALEIIASANLYTIKKYGPDRISGFSPIPGYSMVSYGSGTRYLSLIGGAPPLSMTGTVTCRPLLLRLGASRPTFRNPKPGTIQATSSSGVPTSR